MEARLGFCIQWLEYSRKYKSIEGNIFTLIITYYYFHGS